jgi:hypothetical protein
MAPMGASLALWDAQGRQGAKGRKGVVAEPRADGLMAAHQLGTPAGIEAKQTRRPRLLRKPSCIRELCHRLDYWGVLKFDCSTCQF